MTIQEAIKSGKPFKRNIEWMDVWFIIQEEDVENDIPSRFLFEEDGDICWEMTPEDILAEDWEIKQ